MRIGIGYDIHKFADNRKLFLGGIHIPHDRGLEGHSDADVLIHAICDALLGAASLGDIGKHFPDSDPKYKDVRSAELLEKVDILIKQKQFRIENIDTVVITESPRISDYSGDIQRSLADILKIEADRINIKSATNEKLGPIGNKEGIASYAVALINK